MEHLDKVHQIIFDMLCAIDDLCHRHNIQYFLDAGTLLGAVRHKDFIPWDDDADLTMRREEYEKLLKVAHELPEPYRLITPDDYGGYFFDFIPRFINTEELLRSPTPEDEAQLNHQNCIAVDIFLLDEAPDSSIAFRRQVLRQKMVYGNAMAHRYEKNKKKYSFVQALQVKTLRAFGRCMSLSQVLQKQEKIAQAYRGKEGKYYWQANGLVSDLHRRWERNAYVETVQLPLRDRLFDCPAGWDHILTTFYGDYMTPPKEEDRRPMHL